LDDQEGLMIRLVGAAVGLAVLGVPGAVAGLLAASLWSVRRIRSVPPSTRSILLVLLVELRSGLSTLAALQAASAFFPDHPELTRVARVATVDGLASAPSVCAGELRRLVTQLARAQRSGAAAAGVVRSLLETGIADERSRRLRVARSLPVKLMVPTSLMLLPGLMLMFYAPGLLRMLDDLSGRLT
jgi:tight adherence protein C